MVEVDLAIESEAWNDVADAAGWVDRAVEAAVKAAAPKLRPGTEVSISLAGDERVREVNRAFRGKDRPTNVLSFPAPAGGPLPLLGDIIVAAETTRREAAEEGKLPEHHLAHLVVHGILHLLGYDHENDADAETMEQTERAALALIGISDPYAGTEPADRQPRPQEVSRSHA